MFDMRVNETIKVTAVMEIAAPKINKSKNKTETITPTHANWKNKTESLGKDKII